VALGLAALVPYQAEAQSAPTDKSQTLKSLGQQHQDALAALSKAHEQEVRALLTPDQAPKYGTDEPIPLSYDQTVRLKEIDRRFRAKKRTLESDYDRQIGTVLTPEEIAEKDAQVKARKAEAFARLPLEEQRVVSLLRQSEEQMAALRADRDAKVKALLTPEQVKAYDEEEGLSLTPEQSAARKAIEKPYLAQQKALEAATNDQLNALLSALTPEQAAKYRKPSVKGGFVTPNVTGGESATVKKK
jgi:hypothetical protein